MIVCPTCTTPNSTGAKTCSTCGSPLGSATSTASSPMALPPGTKLNGGAFSVGRVLGQGGFGLTYKGNDINLARLVAIKEFFPDGSRRQGSRVERPHSTSEAEWDIARRESKAEAQTVARFRHPSIVNVHSVWEENNTVYQAMEFLDGHSVGALVEKGKLTEAQALPIIERVADALEEMHTAGFIHRDLKPDNIVQTKDGRIVLIDFGAAKQFVREKTQKLNPVLTPGYAPLEQYSSQARFDHRLDVYALGATLYHLLTGAIPVDAAERAVGVEMPSVRDKNPGVSRSVSDAIERAMAVKVGERFDSARDFAKALRTTKQTPTPRGKTQTHALSSQIGSVTFSQICSLGTFGIRREEAKTLSEVEAFEIISYVGSSPVFSQEEREKAREFFNHLKNSPRVPPNPTPSPKPRSAPQPKPNFPVPAPKPVPSPPSNISNPYLPQIRVLYQDLKNAPAPSPFAGQARLDTIERELRLLEGWQQPAATNCPGCHQNTVTSVTGNFSQSCPFDGAQLASIEWPIDKCAVCRVGTLQWSSIGTEDFVCGVCRRSVVQKSEIPRFLNFPRNVHWDCPTCHAEYVPVGLDAARLSGVDPARSKVVGTPTLGQTYIFAQWNDVSNVSGQMADCSHCQARFMEQKNGDLRLVTWNADLFEVGRYSGLQTAKPERWAQIAAGAGQKSTTRSAYRCQGCRAYWVLDSTERSFTLLSSNIAERDQALKWGFKQGQPNPLES